MILGGQEDGAYTLALAYMNISSSCGYMQII
jgi:hypothetical protein